MGIPTQEKIVFAWKWVQLYKNFQISVEQMAIHYKRLLGKVLYKGTILPV